MEFANAATAIGILTIFVNPFTEEFGWSRTEISAVTSLGAVMGASLAPFSGRLVDRIGSRWVLTLGGTLVVVACVYLASVQSLLGFYVGYTIARTADQGLIKIGAAPAVGKWFRMGKEPLTCSGTWVRIPAAAPGDAPLGAGPVS